MYASFEHIFLLCNVAGKLLQIIHDQLHVFIYTFYKWRNQRCVIIAENTEFFHLVLMKTTLVFRWLFLCCDYAFEMLFNNSSFAQYHACKTRVNCGMNRRIDCAAICLKIIISIAIVSAFF